MMDYLEQRTIILAAREGIPEKFGLRAYPELTFRVSERDSYVNDSGVVQLYTEVLRGDKWMSFAKGTPGELKMEIVADPNAPKPEPKPEVFGEPCGADLPPDPDEENDARAERAGRAITAYQGTDVEDESHFGDLLCDLKHWADRNGRDFDQELYHARFRYEEETMPSDSDEQDPGEPHKCQACGRPEGECSANPCAAVIEQRGQ